MMFLPKLLLWLLFVGGLFAGIMKLVAYISLAGIGVILLICGVVYFFAVMKHHFLEGGIQNG